MSIVSAVIRQGPYSAVETVTVAEAGTGTLGAFELTTSQAPASASYCYSVQDPQGGAPVATTCPAQEADPGTVEVAAGSVRGGSVEVELIVTGGGFALGSVHLVSVTASDGSQASAQVQVVPA